jgi:two-component system, response regulator YesN
MQTFLDKLRQQLDLVYHDESLKATNLHHHLQMSRSALHYKLKKYTGLSTARYLSRFRVEKASQFLIESTDPVKVIAYQVGFRDPNYFSRVFKLETGYSPRDYRNQHFMNNSASNPHNNANDNKGISGDLTFTGIYFLRRDTHKFK